MDENEKKRFQEALDEWSVSTEDRLKIILLHGSLRRDFDILISEWNSHNKGRYIEFKEKFHELHQWILNTNVMSDTINKLEINDISGNECYFSLETDIFIYSIHAERSTDAYQRGELDGTLLGKEKNSGSNDLRDGPYSEKTWRAIINQIFHIEANIRQNLKTS